MGTYHTQLEIDLVPQYHSDDPPEIIYGIDGTTRHLVLDAPRTLMFDQDLAVGPHRVFFDFTNKKDSDTIPEQNLDKKITVGQIRFHGFSIPKFNWIAEYYPTFPEPWYSEQTVKPDACLIGATVMGWNGRWQLAFEAPVFPWIHRIENMGWVWPLEIEA